MLAKTVDVHEAQIHFKDLLSQVLAGKEIVLTEGDAPIARLVPVARPTATRTAGLHPGAAWTSLDFDEPLSEGFWTGVA